MDDMDTVDYVDRVDYVDGRSNLSRFVKTLSCYIETMRLAVAGIVIVRHSSAQFLGEAPLT